LAPPEAAGLTCRRSPALAALLCLANSRTIFESGRKCGIKRPRILSEALPLCLFCPPRSHPARTSPAIERKIRGGTGALLDPRLHLLRSGNRRRPPRILVADENIVQYPLRAPPASICLPCFRRRSAALSPVVIGPWSRRDPFAVVLGQPSFRIFCDHPSPAFHYPRESAVSGPTKTLVSQSGPSFRSNTRFQAPPINRLRRGAI